ncbi:hypothetical protein B0H19DRAFT_386422 [Mycena capillaripes]|nr:hypothetical protein B0H19DRAFT_386422 [Mycena capillaripes]
MSAVSSALLLGQSTTSSFERQAKALITASEENVARIDSQIRDLMRLREQERGFITALKQAIAPIRKLPTELLLEIFTEALGSCFGIKDVLRICQVCAYWKQLACTTPKLWTMLLPIKTKKPAYVAMTKTFLERSAPLPIPISFMYDNESFAPALVEFLYNLAPRWWSFTLCNPSLTLWNSSLSKLQKLPLDSLKSLEEVTLRSYIDIPTYEPKIKAFLYAPRLHTVDLAVRRISHFPMPWAQLTDLNLDGGSGQTCLDILLQCRNIVVAKFLGMKPWIQPPPSAPTTVLPRLNHLEVAFVESSGLGGDHITSFFTRLDLPALTSLNVMPEFENVLESADFAPFLRRSPNIQHLTINHSNLLEPTDLISILLAVPHLVELDIDLCMSCIDDTVLEFLRYSVTHTIHSVPRLQELHFGDIGCDFQESALKDMIKSRWWSDAVPLSPPVSRWKLIRVHREDGAEAFSQSFQSSMDRLRRQGLDVKIS